MTKKSFIEEPTWSYKEGMKGNFKIQSGEG